MDVVGLVLIVVAVYLALGLVFAVPFAAAWVGKIDPAARGSGWGFRLMIVPGSAVVWPVLVWRLMPDRVIPGGPDEPGTTDREGPA